MLCEFHASVTELEVCAVLRKFAGAVGATGFVVALVVEFAEPRVLVAVKRKLYAVFAARPVIVAVVALAPGAGVHVCHEPAAVLYSNV